MNLATFRAAFPEFVDVGDALIEAKIADATTRCDPLVWVHLTEEGIGLLAADLVASSPFGRAVRLVQGDDLTTYRVQFDRLAAAVSGGFRLI